VGDGSEYDDFFEGSAPGSPSFKFNGEVGDVVSGEILDQYKTQQTEYKKPDVKLFFDDGKPRMQLNVTLQTSLRNWDRVTKIPTDDDGNEKPASDDDGKRRVYIKSDMQRAVGKAIFDATGEKGGLRNGGKLAVKLTGFKDTGKGNPLPLYEARYSAPAPKETDGFFEDGTAGKSEPVAETKPAATDGGWSDEPPF
jgi:hypothetical protein